MSDRKHLLTVLAGGGFTFETRCLLQSLDDQATFTYLGQPLGGRPGVDGLPPGTWHEVPMFGTVTNPSLWLSVKAFIANVVKARSVLRAEPIDMIVGIGCSHVVPLFLAGRLAGRPTIYIESMARVDQLSRTGRIVYRFGLATLFLVQWPELAKQLPRARLGSVL